MGYLDDMSENLGFWSKQKLGLLIIIFTDKGLKIVCVINGGR